ncbi:ATP-binding protein [Pseudosulfitobacter koreensis]|uniref:ATP-binding protein n=1 Tax=Pseudosulfitobacter koreensis TaxID=2968472 RepID=A0ABT1Z148_9RHOB|nr:ATP-binding protein [Pseudosulfitobacter koreense]MCR8826865.1 ATP-binding protein [Pseudosulfitobacter koreense]
MMQGSPVQRVHNALPPVQITVQSGPQAARQVLEQLKRTLSPLPLASEDLSAVDLVLAEAVNNISEHAYGNGARRGPIEVICRQHRDGLHFTITDQGAPMPDGRAPPGLAVDVNVDLSDMPEGGFGWFLIRDLARDVTYLREGATNKLSLRMAVALR